MRIFISYASEQSSIAEQLAVSLRQQKHDVFFAGADLRAGNSYYAEIRQKILDCELFIFLISPASVSARYPMSELDTLEKASPTPGARVLPVEVESVPIDRVPNYVRPLTILRQVGDLVTDILNRVTDISQERERQRIADQARRAELQRSLSVFREADQSSEIVGRIQAGEEVTVTPVKDNPNWMKVKSKDQDGWAMAQDIVAMDDGGGATIAIGQGFGYRGDFWSLYFTSPQKEGRPPNQYGIDMRFADAVGRTEQSIDIAVFEFNSKLIADAIVEAHRRGVKVRVVTGQLGYKEPDSTFRQLEKAGIPVVVRPDQAILMHNKFAVLDGKTVWTGSWNYTEGATYRNNENAIALEGEDIAGRYVSVFTQMFEEKRFGVARKPAPSVPVLNHGVQVMFAPEDPIVPELLKRIRGARRSILFMAFIIRLDEIVQALIERSQQISVRGLLEPHMARAAGAHQSLWMAPSQVEIRFATSPRFLHHDVVVIDDETVITGSVNFDRKGPEVNDENIVFIPDPMLARKYAVEFSRLWNKGSTPPQPEVAPRAARTARKRRVS
jgi:phosphatidylserine/phosphatidylglycerophosphate/cardiolipin synthase-like enzyme